jgi:two-component system, LytTR family, response regulator
MYNCLVIDDEAHMVDAIVHHINKTDYLIAKDTCYDGEKAMALLAANDYDIVFCDIRMPKVGGMELVKAYKHKTLFIMCTGFPEYAAESFDLAVIDFLVKPILYPRFMQGVQKALDILNAKKKVLSHEDDFMFVQVENKGRVERVNYDDILYIEAQKNYTNFILKAKKQLSSYTLKQLEEKLPVHRFLRVHKSFIVPIDKIQQVDNTGLLINDLDITIPIGASYREEVMTRLRIK